ncbi:MAG: hypothetical protein ABFE13_11440 [Phycisphaerales bacterium]
MADSTEDRVAAKERDARLGGVEAALTGLYKTIGDTRHSVRMARIRSGELTEAQYLKAIRAHLKAGRKWSVDAENMAKSALAPKKGE